MKIAETVTFGGAGLDRAAQLRGDADGIARLLADEKAGILPIWRGKPLIGGQGRDHAVWLPVGHDLFAAAAEEAFFLGLDGAAPRFSMDISAWEPAGVDPEELTRFFDPSEQHHPLLPEDQRFSELRGVMPRIPAMDAELIACAKALHGWHQSHRYCSRCGEKSRVDMSGWQRRCPACGARHFPRTDPVVIMLITRDNQTLIGRSPGWPEGMYSLLAGFMEPGETVEAAVRREVFEETGIKIGVVEYLASQPWPFPASLMIGCHGLALDSEITLDPVELEDAVWVTREEMMEVFAGTHETIRKPRNGSIAHFLLSNWLADRLG